MKCKLIVQFVNLSLARLDCKDLTEAYESANRLSFSSGKIRHVAIKFEDGQRDLWDSTWSEESKAAGLLMPR